MAETVGEEIMNIKTLLVAIPSTEPATFSEFCRALGDDCPERGDKEEWADLFDTINQAENLGLIEVDRNGRNTESLQLTEAGAAKVRGR